MSGTVHFDLTPEVVWQLIEPNYSLLASGALLFYDYLLTFQDEVHLVWRAPRWSISTAFYLAIRYGTIIVLALGFIHVMPFAPHPRMTHESCRVILDFLVILNAINFAVISAFVAIRISARWDRNWYLCALLFTMGLINPASVTVLLGIGFEAIPGPWPLVACVSYLPDDSTPLVSMLTMYFPLVSSAICIVYELLCLLLTVAKTYSLYREQRRVGMPTRLTSLLLRDGSLYFTVLSALAVVNIIAASLPQGSLPPDIQINTNIARVLTPILITRFIVDLRNVQGGDDQLTTSATDHLPVRFRKTPNATSTASSLSIHDMQSFEHSDVEAVELEGSCAASHSRNLTSVSHAAVDASIA